jgi:hypothetical protein
MSLCEDCVCCNRYGVCRFKGVPILVGLKCPACDNFHTKKRIFISNIPPKENTDGTISDRGQG